MVKQKNKQNLEKLIKQNLKKTELLIEKIEDLNKNFKRAQIMNLIRFLIVTIPVILAILYLIPLFREFIEIYQPLLDLINQFRGI